VQGTARRQPLPPASPTATAEQVVERLSPQLDLRVGGGEEKGLRLSGTVGVVVMMGLLTLLPMLLLMMTSFTRIFIVFSFLKQALGTQSAPPAQLVAGLAMLLTGFVMAPTFSQLNREALQPWLAGEIEQAQMMEIGARPFKAFMLRQTRPSDVRTFVRMSGQPAPARAEDVPLVTLTSAFVTSELRTAFQIGFALFLPFIVIDIVVSAVLMSMGMMMLPPAMISLPFKLLLFVLVDGWSLVMQSLVASFR
jgi:flagellar biosynthetic protein FliP